MGQRPILESVGNSLATDGLLADARDHLTDVDVGALGAADGHDERRIVSVQVLEAGVARLVADHGQLLQNDGLQGLRRIAAGLALQLALRHKQTIFEPSLSSILYFKGKLLQTKVVSFSSKNLFVCLFVCFIKYKPIINK